MMCSECNDFYVAVNNTCIQCNAGPVCKECSSSNVSICM